jgi:prepilin-type N-terminal cleavage/methylation domain-containing protein
MDQTIRQECGFTLLELLIVFFLISVILGISTVYFANSLPGSRFNAAVREMTSVIRHARILARTAGEEKVLNIDMDAGSYALEGREPKMLPPDVTVKIEDPFAGELIRGVYRLTFRPLGAMEGGSIILSGAKRKVVIEMDPIAGVVAVRQ